MKKFLLKASMVLLLPIMLVGCGSEENKSSKESGKVEVTASISPIKEFTELIGGDKIEVTSLVPDNAEPHDIDLKPRDFEKLTKSKLFIYNGLGMEDWLDEVKEQISEDKIKYVDTSENGNVIKTDGKIDPHQWLSLKEAINQCNNIKLALSEVDPNNKDYYEENYEKVKNDFEELYNEYLPKFQSLEHKNFVTSHEAFGYLCRDFGLKQQALNDLFGEGELTAKKIEDLVKYCDNNDVNTIFSEEEDSQKEAQTLANEINGEVKPLYTLETKVEGKSYLEVMKINLEEIYESMDK
ncbi:MAG: zinc ABC transporter substrate-binding protein [Clostridium sp.]|nr:zinc ABC transporter substrate-binding protein [Clostridium sp.]MCI7444020.1 zinc ABC transporter substrate-binding protein [Clostridium sp.]